MDSYKAFFLNIFSPPYFVVLSILRSIVLSIELLLQGYLSCVWWRVCSENEGFQKVQFLSYPHKPSLPVILHLKLTYFEPQNA